MHVRRRVPHLPGTSVLEDEKEYANVIKSLFSLERTVVTQEVVRQYEPELTRSIDNIIGRRKKYLAGRK